MSTNMDVNVNIPQIAITPGSEEEDSQNSLMETVTDIEALEEEADEKNGPSPQKSNKFKLKIKLMEDGFATDIEDFETSDIDEDNADISDTQWPLPLDNLHLEEGITEESLKIEIKSANGRKKLKAQNSVVHLDTKEFVHETFEMSCFTDEESFNTDNECHDLDTILESYHADDSNILEKLQDFTELQYSLGNPSINTLKNMINPTNALLLTEQNIATLSISPNLSDLTDVEILNSDSNHEADNLQNRSRRRQRRANNKKQPNSGVDDLESPIYDFKNKLYHKKSKKKELRGMVRSQSLTFDSDNDDKKLSVPFCRQVIQRNQNLLKMSDGNNDFITDTEEIENELEDNSSIQTVVLPIEDAKLENKLNDVASYCGQVQEVYTLLSECKRSTMKKQTIGYKDHVTDDNTYEINGELLDGANSLNLDKRDETLMDNEIIDSSLPIDFKNINSGELNLTEEEEFGENDSNDNYPTPEMHLPASNSNLIILKENESFSTVQMLPLQEELMEKSLVPLSLNDTDEELFSDKENITELSQNLYDFKDYIPHLFLPECGSIKITENETQRNSKTLNIPHHNNESVTDTEELYLEMKKKNRKAPTFKHIFGNRNELVPKTDIALLTDTEDLYFSDTNTDNRTSSALNSHNDVVTDTENLGESSEEDRKSIKHRSRSCTPIHMREMGSDMIIFKEGSGPFSLQDRMTVNKQVRKVKYAASSPVLTDTEEVYASADEDLKSYSRAETATPSQIHKELDQMSSTDIRTEVLRKFNTDSTVGVMYLKGGGYVERNTDIEYISDEELSSNKVSNGSQSFMNDFLYRSIKKSFSANGLLSSSFIQEWDASRKPAEPESKTLEKDAAQQDISATGPQFVTYESVLLTPTRSMSPCLSDSQYLHKTTSYTQIDAILEKMLYEVEKQEKLFGLDLDVLEPEEQCVNTLELLPTTDALIEVPIKKSVKKHKIYETSQEIIIKENKDDDPYELISFNNDKSKGSKSDHLYDLISFNENGEETKNLTENINNDTTNMIEEASSLTNLLEGEDLERPYTYKLDLERATTASSESLSDNYPDSWNDPDEGNNLNESFIDDDYELIENRPLCYAYQLHDNRTGNDIWWEGTYRNLSIVPEEDEENLSLLSSCYSNKVYVTKPYARLDVSDSVTTINPESRLSSKLSSLDKEIASDVNDSTSGSSSTISTSSDEGTYETCEKIVKAEVKLLVKTSDKGKEAIEIRSVREFMDNSGKKNNDCYPNRDKKIKEKSHTLPNRLSEKFSNITNKFSNLLDKKKSASYSLLSDTEHIQLDKKDTDVKPSYTLQRLFIRNPDIASGARLTESNLLNTKELSNSKTELVATSNKQFPLEYNPESVTNFNEDSKVDLYANIPFYPCYNQYSSKSTSPHSNPFTEFVSDPFNENSQIPQAYCDWLLQKEDASRGKTTSSTHYLISNEEIPLIEKPVRYIIPLKSIYDQTNALIQSESRAEPYHPHTEKYYKLKSSEDEKQDISQTDSLKEEKKRKKGILGTIKTFVGKSLDHSDSDSEKSPKKERKPKKDKKKKKTLEGDLPPEIPVRPPRKPKLPTPTEERKYADIPYFEASPESPPSYQPPAVPVTMVISDKFLEKDIPIKTETFESKTLKTTDLNDAETDVPKDIKDKAKEIVKEVITDGEKVVTQLQKSPKPKKQTIIIVDEKVSKTFTPAAVEEEEFTIIIDPTKKGSPKKTKETFTLNIDESIDKKEKEILEKSPILPDEKLIKPIAQIEAPMRPPRIKDHVYEDIEEPVHSIDDTRSLPIIIGIDTKTATINLIQNEIHFAGWADDKHNLCNLTKASVREETKEKLTDSQKMKRKHGKLLGLFSKTMREGEDSDEDNKKEVVEKHDKETSKEQEVSQKPKKDKNKEKQQEAEIGESQKSPKKGKVRDKEDKKFLGLFKKGKKGEPEARPAFSDSVIKDMIESTAFLKEEVDKYHDVKPVIDKKVQKEIDVNLSDTIKSGTKVESVALFNQTLEAMKESDSFLRNEVDKYHDVHPFKLPVDIEGKSKLVVDEINSEEKEVKKQLDRPLLSETDFGDMHESKLFLENEVNIYHDVHPIIKEKVEEKISLEKLSYDKQTEGKGFFGLFKRKPSEDKEIEPKSKDIPKLSLSPKKCVVETEITKSEIKKESEKYFEPKVDKIEHKPMLTDTAIREMHEADSFLKEEINNYYDVRHIPKQEITKSTIEQIIEKSRRGDLKEIPETIKETQPDKKYLEKKETESKTEKSRDQSVKVDKKEEEEDGKRFLGIFKKKKVEEKETIKKPVLSDAVIKEMHESDSFLTKEVERYHDVRPVVKDIAAITKDKTSPQKEPKSDGKGIFELFKKKKSEERETEPKIEKTIEKPILSENVVRDIHETDSFLSGEVDKYHDVRPINKEPHIIKEKEPLEKVQKILPQKEQKGDAGKGIFDSLNKKKSGEKETEFKIEETINKPVLSENVVSEMHESGSFLRGEIDKYHDVRPIVKLLPTTTKEKIPSEKEQKSITLHKETMSPQKEQKGEGKGIFGIFKKKKSEETESKIKSVEKPILSENVIRDMHESESFLREEINKYHDVRPLVEGPPVTIEEKILKEKEPRQIVLKKEKSTLQAEQKDEGKGIFGLFKKKKSEEIETESKTEKTIDKPLLSENVIRDMHESDSFLREEIEKYHDVCPTVKGPSTTVEEKISKKKEKQKEITLKNEKMPPHTEQKDEEKGIFGLFKKKKSEEKETESRIQSIDKPLLSEIVIRDMHESDSFLRKEIDKYHDVRPLIKESPITIEEKIPTEKAEKGIVLMKEKVSLQTEQKGKGMFGLFKKKTSEEKETESKIKSVDNPLFSENIIRDMHESESFLREEINKYHDVGPLVKGPPITIEEKIPKEKEQRQIILKKEKTSLQAEQKDEGKGVFGLFKKKKSEEKETETKIEKTIDMPLLSENVIKDMHESDSFIREEIEKYHDVRPTVKRPSTTVEEKIPKEKEQKDEGKGIFGLFKKKKSEEKATKSGIQSIDKPLLSENVIQDMHESDSFLREEIDKYHDVRPLIKEPSITIEAKIPKEKDQKEITLKKEETSLQKQKDEDKGIFGIFKKKSEEKETESQIKRVDKPLLSENVMSDMHESESFLRKEIDKYHDVYPLIKGLAITIEEKIPKEKEQKEITSKKEKSSLQTEQKGEGKGIFGLFKKKKSEEKETESKIEKTIDKPLLSENVIRDMHESDSFLREEIEKYHDVRPTVKGPSTTVDEKISKEKEQKEITLKKEKMPTHTEQKDEGKGIFGLFKKKKSDEKETKSGIQSIDKPLLSENVIRDMHESDSFLREEIDKYHDVRPLIKEPSITIEAKIPKEKDQKEITLKKEETSLQKQKDEEKGLFGIVKKKSEEKEIESQIKRVDKPLLSENVMSDMHESESFLREEIDKYHDVYPLIKGPSITIEEKIPKEKEQKEITSKKEKPSLQTEQKGEGKGIFGLFKKKKSEEKETESKIEKTVDKPLLSEKVIREMHESESFLREEIDKYHDVRPLVKGRPITIEEKIPKEKEQKEITLKKEKKSFQTEQKGEGKGIFGLFKKKKSEEKEIQSKIKSVDKPLLSESVIGDMHESDSFLKVEIAKHHDVRPLVKEPSITTEEKIPKEKEQKEITLKKEKMSSQSEQKDEGKGIFGLFKKKKSEEKQDESKIESDDKPLLSENIIRDMHESDSFLRKEIDRYHDVRPLIKEPPITIDEKISKGKKQKEITSPHQTEQKDEGKGIFGLFKKKKSDEKETETKIEKTVDKPLLSENVIRDMHESDSFLREEIDRYHDVRPLVKRAPITTEEKIPDEKEQKENILKKEKISLQTEQKDEGKGIFGLFKKKKSEEYKTELKIESVDKPLVSENVIRDMHESDSFLRAEIDKYHDVRPVFNQSPTKVIKLSEKEQKDILLKKEKTSPQKESKDEGKGVFGLFKKRRSEEKDSESIGKPVLLSENVIKSMKETDLFLKEQINKYHDVRPIIKPIVVEEKKPTEVKQKVITSIKEKTQKEQKDDGKGLFGFFKKKKSEEKEIEIKVEEKVDKSVLSEKVIQNMHESDSLLKEEIEKYHDVHPVINKPLAAIKEKIPQEEEEIDEAKGFLGLFKKKRSDEKTNELKVVKTQEKPVLSEIVIKDIEESESFLNEEINRYHDVRPNVERPILTDTKIISSDKERKDDDKGFLRLFKKRKSEEKELKPKGDKLVLSENTVRDMQDTESFLCEEINRYHDVPPIVIKDIVTSEEEEKYIYGICKKGHTGVEGVEQKPKGAMEKPVLSEIVRDIHESDIELKIQKTADKPTLSETAPKDEGKGFLGILKKKGSEDKENEPEVKIMKDKLVLSEKAIRDMQETDSFLNEEVIRYHDVRPIVSQPAVTTDEARGFFGLFRKKKTEEKETKQSMEKLIMSENVIEEIYKNNVFLKEEIDRYQDVRPIVELTTQKTQLPKKEQGSEEPKLETAKVKPISCENITEEIKTERDEDGKVLLGLIKRRSEEIEIEPIVEKTSTKPVLSENVLKDMQESDLFLKEETDRYHDVRPIVDKAIPITKGDESTEKSDGKGIFGLFKKKRSDDKEIEPKIEKVKEKPVLSENVIKAMNDSTSFLEQEIKRFQDVRPVVKELPPEAKEETLTEKGQKDGKGLLGLFKKKKSGKKDIELITDKPALSEKVIIDMKQSESFLIEEIAGYHDVRPIVKEIAPTITEKLIIQKEHKRDGKGFFGLFKKKRSEEREADTKIEKIVDKPLSETVIRNMNESDSFLKQETNRYHDVRPIVKTAGDKAEGGAEKEEEDDRNSFLKLTKKKRDEQEGEAQKITGKPVLSENTIKNIKESDTFLKTEIEKYHDEPFKETFMDKIETTTEQPKEELIHPTKVTRIDKKPIQKLKLTTSESEKVLEEKITEEKQGLSKTKDGVQMDSEAKNIHETTNFLNTELERYEDTDYVNVSKVEPSAGKRQESMETKQVPKLSETTLLNMITTSDFIREEVAKYHDVKPEINIDVIKKPEEKLSKSGKIFGLFGKKKSLDRESSSEPEKKEVKKEKKKSKSKEKDTQKLDTKEGSTVSRQEGQETDSKNFLEGEIDRYHDKGKTEKSSEIPLQESEGLKDKSSGFFGLFSKKNKPQEKTDTTEKGVEKELSPKKTAQESTELISDSAYFIENEVRKYDTQYQELAQQPETDKLVKDIHAVLKNIEEIKQGTGKMEGEGTKLIPKTITEKEISVKDIILVEPNILSDVSNLDEEIKMKVENIREEVKLIGDEEKHEIATIQMEVQMPPSESCTTKTMTEEQCTELITKEEIKDKKSGILGRIGKKKSHEKEPSVERHVVTAEENVRVESPKLTDRKKSGSPFKIFGKKQVLDEEIQKKPVASEQICKPHAVSEDAITKIQDTHSFLSTEITNYEDGKPKTIKDIYDISKHTEEIKHETGRIIDVELKQDQIINIQGLTLKSVPTKSTGIIVAKDGIQLEPNVLSDVSNLEEEIAMRIENLREEVKIFDDVEKDEIVVAQLEHQIPFSTESSVTKIMADEHSEQSFSKEIKDKEKKSGILGRIGKKKSHEKESSIERSVITSEENVHLESPKLKDRKKSGSPFKIFGKKQVSDDEPQKIEVASELVSKPVELSQDALRKMQETHSFLLTEVTNYEDGKLELITDLDEDTEKIKSSGLFGIFSKKEKSASPKVPKRKLKKYKVTKSTEERKDLGLLGDTDNKFTTTYVDFKEGADDKIDKISDSVNDFTELTEKLIDDIKHDTKIKKVAFADVKNDITKSTDKAVSDLGEVIKKDIEKFDDSVSEKADSVVTTLDSFNMITDTLKKIEDTPETVDINAMAGTSAYKEINKEKEMIVKTPRQAKYEVAETLKSVIKPVESKTMSHMATSDIDSTERRFESTADSLTAKDVENIDSDPGDKIKQDSTKKQIKDKSEKSKKSFFSKLGAKIGVKTDDVKTAASQLEKVATVKTENIIPEKIEKKTILVPEREVQQTLKSALDEAKFEEQTLKDETSSFVTEIMQSFDDTLEHVKEEKINTEGNRIDTITTVDSMSQKVTGNLQDTQQFLENEKECTNKLTGFAIRVQNVDDAVTKASLAEIQEIKETVIETFAKTSEAGRYPDSSSIHKKKSEQVVEIDDSIKHQVEKLSTLGEAIKKDVTPAEEVLVRDTVLATDKQQSDMGQHTTEKSSKKSKTFLGKLGKKIGNHGDESKDKFIDEVTKLDSDVKQKKSQGFFGKLGDKLTGKTGEVKGDTEQIKYETNTIAAVGTESKSNQIEAIELKYEEPQYENVYVKLATNAEPNIKKVTLDFIQVESFDTGDTKITRTTSDYGSKMKDINDESPRKISEANIDLSNLPTNIDRYPSKSEKASSSYVTSPNLARRSVSQRFAKGERPDVVEIRDSGKDSLSDDDDWYIVTEPDEITPLQKELSTRKPLFHIESEDDDSMELRNVKHEIDRQDSSKSNILETLTELKIDALLTDLTKNLSESHVKPLEDEIKNEGKKLEEHKKESQTEVDLIEKKLRDLDKALDSLEQMDAKIDTSKNDLKTEKKLKRVERKFERMASEVLDKDVKDGKQEEKQENEYHRLVSQLSTEEISDFQKEYSHLWDEHTFSKSDDWDSKTPDSQEDVQELPQGEEASASTVREPSPSVRAQVTRRRPLRYEISIEDQTEVDPREHDWRFNLPKHAEGEESVEKDESGSERKIADQHELSEEMKALLKELEKESKQ